MRIKPRWELTLRGRLVGTLASLAMLAAWMTSDPHAALAAALLLAPLLVDVLWHGGASRLLELSIADRRTQAGTMFIESAWLHNRDKHRPARNLVVTEPRTNTRAGGCGIEALAPGESTELNYPGRCWRRGRETERVFVCEAYGPLGLVSSRRLLRAATELIAEPTRVVLPKHVDRATANDDSDSSPRALRHGRDFYGLREYRFGEDARGVHALRSAAAGTLVRRIERSDQPHKAGLVLDLRRPPGHDIRRSSRRFEWSLSAAATLVDEMTRRRVELNCIVLASEIKTFAIHGGRDAEAFLAFLADTTPSCHVGLTDAIAEEMAQQETCYWIPAGGFSALEDRIGLRRVILVSKELGP